MKDDTLWTKETNSVAYCCVRPGLPRIYPRRAVLRSYAQWLYRLRLVRDLLGSGFTVWNLIDQYCFWMFGLRKLFFCWLFCRFYFIVQFRPFCVLPVPVPFFVCCAGCIYSAGWGLGFEQNFQGLGRRKQICSSIWDADGGWGWDCWIWTKKGLFDMDKIKIKRWRLNNKSVESLI